MAIDIDITHVARLARLGLSEDELATYEAQLGAILEHAARVQGLGSDDGAEIAHPLGLINAYREDEVGESLDRDEVLAQAPASRDGYFEVPPATEKE